jgi:hypothetical protein
MMFESEKMENIRVSLSQNIDEQFRQKSYAEYSLALESCQYAGLRNEELVKAAFYQYSDDSGARVRYAEGVGLIMIR